MVTESTQPIATERPPSSAQTDTGSREWKAWAILAFPVTWLAYVIVEAIVSAWHTRIPLAILLTATASLFLWVVSAWAIREYRAAGEVKHMEEIDSLLKNSERQSHPREVKRQLAPVVDRIALSHPEAVRVFRAEVDNRDTIEAYCDLLDNIVLKEVDMEVEQIIRSATVSAAGLVAISPHPALDAMLIIYRATTMTASITRAYGRQATGLSSLRLFRRVVTTAITAAALEQLGTLALENLGMNLTNNALKAVGEGSVAAARIHRLGALTRQTIRPI